jgi:phosphoglycerate dehydrogenase-like enzyme
MPTGETLVTEPKTRPRVAVLPAPGEEGRTRLEPVERVADVRVGTTAEEFADALDGAEVVLVWDFRTTWLRDAWHRAGSLRWLHAASAGVDAVLLPEVVDSDCVVTNSRGVFDQPIAEHVLCTLLLFAKDMLESLALQREHRWQHRESETLAGRRLVIVGVGGIGRAVARLARAVGMDVTGVGRSARDEDPDFAAVVGAGGLDAALAVAEFVVVATPLTPQTRGLFDADRFARLPVGARFVNVGRGALVDEQALVEALRSGQLGGAALDVFATEPLPANSPLWDMRNVVVTPHMAGDFVGWREALGALFADNFARWMAGDPLRNVVDKRKGYVPAESGADDPSGGGPAAADEN